MEPLGLSDITSISQEPRWVLWELPSKVWFKLSIDGSVQSDKAGAGFVARTDICLLIEAGCFPVATNSVLEAEIRVFERHLYGHLLRS